MIVELSVENLAIIERSELSLGPGFTVLTGETGAGKSLLVDALELALGERADVDLVRAGAKSAVVSVAFDVTSNPAALKLCDELGVAIEDGILFIQREVFAEGRSQCRIAGRLAPVSALRQLGQSLVDLHGQHDHQSLLYSDRHLGFLDDWIGTEALDLRSSVKGAYGTAQRLRAQLAALREGVRNREQRLDLLRYQVQEIEQASPQPGEWEEASALLSRLQNSERLSSAARAALAALCDGEQSAMDLQRAALHSLEGVVRFDPQLEELAQPLRESICKADDAVRNLQRYADSLEPDPARLDQIADRLELLKRLRKKYGEDEAAVLSFAAGTRAEAESLASAEQDEGRLQGETEQAVRALDELSLQLSALRKERAPSFSKAVCDELCELALERASFSVTFTEGASSAVGIDQAEFFFSANQGEPSRPLSKVASGGEVSRLMLAIKSVLAGQAGVPTLIFDEVDAGLGGRVAATLGRKLEQLATGYQVLAITHLPQIAARAKTHFRIEKSEQGGRVATTVARLSDSERQEELARMVGSESVTPAALAHARDLLGESDEAAMRFE